MGFDAAASIEALDYDFTTLHHADGSPYEGKGTIPEPSRGQLDKFFASLRQVFTEIGVDTATLTDSNPQQLGQAFMQVDPERLETMSDSLLDAYAELCQGSPTREQIAALPFRIQQAWMGWLTGELTDPTRQQSGMRPSPAARNGAAFST